MVFSGFVIAITTPYPVGIYQLQINDRNNGSIYDNNTRTRSNEVVLVSFLLALISHLSSGVFTVNFERVYRFLQIGITRTSKKNFIFSFCLIFFFFFFLFNRKKFLWKGNLYKFWKMFQSFGQKIWVHRKRGMEWRWEVKKTHPIFFPVLTF